MKQGAKSSPTLGQARRAVSSRRRPGAVASLSRPNRRRAEKAAKTSDAALEGGRVRSS